MTTKTVPADDVSLGVLTVFAQEIPGKANAFLSLITTEHNASWPRLYYIFLARSKPLGFFQEVCV